MGAALKLISLKSFSYDNESFKTAFVVSILVHTLVFVCINKFSFNAEVIESPHEEQYVDFGYQEFEEVPEVVDKIVEETKEIDPIEKDDTTREEVAKTEELQDQASEVVGTQVAPPKPIPQPVQAVTRPSGSVTDVPYYKVKPKYPKEAILSGTEGYVEMVVDIREDGGVENIRVTGGEKVVVFESEARRAVAKWKYKPFVSDAGAPIKKENHIIRVDFKLVEQAAATVDPAAVVTN